MPRKPKERESRPEESTQKLPTERLPTEQLSTENVARESIAGEKLPPKDSFDNDVSDDTLSLNNSETLIAQGYPLQGFQNQRSKRQGKSGLDSLRSTHDQTASFSHASLQDSAHTRRDLLSGDWTIYAPRRGQRPNEFIDAGDVSSELNGLENKISEKIAPYNSSAAKTSSPSSSESEPISRDCPFCSGAEDETPAAVWSGRTIDDSNPLKPAFKIVEGEQIDWSIRVVPNKFPAVRQVDECAGERSEKPVGSSKVFPLQQVVGGHEVFIESPTHQLSLAEVDVADVFLLLASYRDRIIHYRQFPAVQYISIFKNNGSDAGASLSHTHSQLIATSVMPTRVRTILDRVRSHRAQTGCCLQCDLIRSELAERSRIVLTSGELVAFCPFASRHAGMLRVVAKGHNAFFESQDDEQLHALASMLKRLIGLMGQVFPGAAYNYLLHTSPIRDKNRDAFHWSLDLFPRLTKTAGFEWSSDCNIHPMLPESTAAEFRAAASKSNPRQAARL